MDQAERCSCGCQDVPDRGACRLPVQGANGRCVYCDHALACHKSQGRPKTRWSKEPSL